MTPASVTLLHGFLGSPDFWMPVTNRLRRIFPEAHCVCPSLPGHGASNPTSSCTEIPVSFNEAVNWYARQVPTVSPSIGIGYSMGARLTLGTAVAFPALFDCLILISVHPGIHSEEERIARQQWDGKIMHLALEDDMSSLVNYFETLPIFNSQLSLSPNVQQHQRKVRMSHSPTQIAASLPALGLGHAPAMTASLKTLGVPTLFISGESDKKYTEIASELAEMHRLFQHDIIPGAGHNPVLEAPESTTAAIMSFLK